MALQHTEHSANWSQQGDSHHRANVGEVSTSNHGVVEGLCYVGGELLISLLYVDDGSSGSYERLGELPNIVKLCNAVEY